MRVLGIETASRRGSIALIESDGATLPPDLVLPSADTPHRAFAAGHETSNRNAEELLPLVERLHHEAGWARDSIDLVAVGMGPGSFTGLRVGLALAKGMSFGLGVTVLGVPSLAAMSVCVPPHIPGIRIAALDVRRGEIVVEGRDASGAVVLPLTTLPLSEALRALEAHPALAGSPGVLVGEVWRTALCGATSSGRFDFLDTVDTQLPSARWTALIAAMRSPCCTVEPAEPAYAREPDAKLPDLPRSPLASPPTASES